MSNYGIILKKIQNNEHWHELPMDSLLQKYINERVDDEITIPIVNNGYWFVLDRNSMAINEYCYDHIFSRGCLNYTVAVYDTDENILYYFREDT